MSFRRLARITTTCAAMAIGLAAMPASAHEPMGGPHDMHSAHGPRGPAGWGPPPGPPMLGPSPEVRMDWLAECRQRTSHRDDGLSGAAIGGIAGGIAGNRLAGRHHRTTGTIAGAAVGAVAGAIIDRAEDRGRGGDECERYFDEYYEYYAAHARNNQWGQQAYGTGCCQPAGMMRPRPAPECREDVRYITEYVTVPGRRIIPRRPVRDKRVRIAPDKRIRTD